MSAESRPAPASLGPLSDRDLDLLETQARAVARAAPGVGAIPRAVLEQVVAEREARRRGRREETPLDLPAGPPTEPFDVVVDQREAMVRAIELRDDLSLSPELRMAWSEVVDRLARLRHEAKAELAERRRRDPDEPAWGHPDLQARLVAERTDGALGRDLEGADESLASGGGQPAPWQPEAERVGPETGPETTPSGPRTTDQLTSGPGMAGGTGGAGSQNFPAETGAESPPLSPRKDPLPPDVGHR